MTDDWKPWPPNYPSPLVDPDSARKAMKLPTSYPFLALSKVRNVPYADVLKYADIVSQGISDSFVVADNDLCGRLDEHTRSMIVDHVFGYRDIATEVPRIAP